LIWRAFPHEEPVSRFVCIAPALDRRSAHPGNWRFRTLAIGPVAETSTPRMRSERMFCLVGPGELALWP